MTIKTARKQEIKRIVLSALRRIPDPTLPVKIKEICKSYPNIRLIPYSIHMKRHNLSYRDIKEYCGTDDACADYYAKYNKYIIYYNDINKIGIVNSNRYRWNIAHELGHILLEHHKKNKNTRIYRCTLSDIEYDYLETEADYFAQLILVPHVVLYAFNIKNERQLKMLCKISNPAAHKRFLAYKEWRQNINGNDPYDKPLYHYYHNFIYKKNCTSCNANIIQQKGKYCPICGNKTLQWGEGKMIYKKLDAYENGKLKKCPICDNEETNIEGKYCQICGIRLVNVCSNNACSYAEPLPTNARYCPVCGCSASFLDFNILKKWDFNSGFMHIPDEATEEATWLGEELPFT